MAGDDASPVAHQCISTLAAMERTVAVVKAVVSGAVCRMSVP